MKMKAARMLPSAGDAMGGQMKTSGSGQDGGVLRIHVSQVQGVHTYSGLVDRVVERRFLRHVVIGKRGAAGEAFGLSLDPVKAQYGVF